MSTTTPASSAPPSGFLHISAVVGLTDVITIDRTNIYLCGAYLWLGDGVEVPVQVRMYVPGGPPQVNEIWQISGSMAFEKDGANSTVLIITEIARLYRLEMDIFRE